MFHELLNASRNMEQCKSSVEKVVEYKFFFCPKQGGLRIHKSCEKTQFIELASGFGLTKFESGSY